jgi:aspartyl-tRNA(Asn)/glutamyl-tRNA(Gln) amidotransferase subunit A
MIGDLIAAFRAGTDDPVRAFERAIAAADRAQNDHAILSRVPNARAEAEAASARYRAGTPKSALDGIAVAVKDCIDVAGLPSTGGTRFLTAPVAADAIVVQRLRAAGAVVFAKTNMHEFGIQPTGVNPHYGTPVNPWDPDRIPGGSSSGSAVAVASGIVPIAVGTDAGGSIRVPAAVNGLVGLKPTFGAVPLDGIMRLTTDLDHVGPLAWTVEDATLLFEILADRKVDRSATVTTPALLSDFFEGVIDGVDRPVLQAARESFGQLPEVASPFSALAAAVEFVIVGTDAQRTCGDYLRDHGSEMGADTRVILRLGAGLTADDRKRAGGVRAAMRRELDELLQKHDVLIGPALGCLAPRLHRAARETGEVDTVALARLAAQSFVANLTGHPSVVVPCVRDGLPIAMQIIGRHNDEARVLAAARMVERNYGARRPPRSYEQARR